MDQPQVGELSRVPQDLWRIIQKMVDHLSGILADSPTEVEVTDLVMTRTIMVASFGPRCCHLQSFLSYPDPDLVMLYSSSLTRSYWSPGRLDLDYVQLSDDDEIDLHRHSVDVGYGPLEITEVVLDIRSFFLIIKSRLGKINHSSPVELARKRTSKFLEDLAWGEDPLLLEPYLRENLQDPIQLGHRTYETGEVTPELTNDVEEDCKKYQQILEKMISEMV